MALKGISEWRKLPVSLAELCIDTTLRCGQSFRWRKIKDEWTCTLHGRVLSLKQDPTHLHYRVTWPNHTVKKSQGSSSAPVHATAPNDDTEALLRHYFALDLELAKLYEQWSQADPNFRKRAPGFTGVRILSQDAWEALICFICSSNNNIARISQMVHKLCIHYGPLIAHVGDEPLHDFPTPESLAGDGVEAHLRELGFGYRAKYIAHTARMIVEEKPATWLASLRNPLNPGFNAAALPEDQHSTYKEAQEQLLSLAGVGPKVADCVCLMGLGWGESVPVDTHVWQIAQRDYKFGKSKTKTFNKVMYDAVGDHFRSLWGSYAGWAHSVLFTADLREFRATKQSQDGQTPEVKDEEAEEQHEDKGATPKEKRKRKRSMPAEADTEVLTHVKTEVDIKVKIEPDLATKIVEVDRRSKRLRARKVK